MALIKKLMEVAWDMWEHRNGILHADPDKHDIHDELEVLNERLREEHARGIRGLLNQDRYLFRSSVESMLQWPTLQKRTWLSSVELARKAAEAAEAERDPHRGERQRMLNWLATARGPNKRRRRQERQETTRRTQQRHT